MSKALGRGFESLIPTELVEEEFDLTSEEDAKESKLKDVLIDDVVRDEDQPRKEFSDEALEMLAQSIKANGILQPIVVTRDGDKYKIVAGERRWRAARIAGLTKVPVIIRTIDAQNRLELSIIENAQREDLNPIELATAYAKLKTQFNMDAKEIAERVGKSERTIIGTMRLLNLPDDIKKVMIKEKLSEGIMKPLIAADPELVRKILPRIVDEGWTSRRVEKFIAETKKKSSSAIIRESNFKQDEVRISQKYKAVTKIRGRSITITCGSDEELKELLNLL